jgi:D-psicose/D-tagatose/L-ribulose 3-epimerase
VIWPIAANTFIWHSPLSDKILRSRLPQLAEWGFDAVELPVENVDDWTPRVARDLLTEAGLRSVVGAVFAPGRELAAAPISVVAAGIDYMHATIDLAAEQGSEMVIGPMYTSVGRTWRITPEERHRITEDLIDRYRDLGEYARQRGIKLAIEPLNRYETSVFNTTAQLLDVVERVGDPSVGINLDTYHMNIEERSFGVSIRAAGSHLFHIQVCGNDRGAPGHDLTPWDDVFSALSLVGYDGLLGIESFTAENASISVAASIWRPLAPTQDQLATDGLAFLRSMRDRYLSS